MEARDGLVYPSLYKTTGNNNAVAKVSRIGANAMGGKKSVRYFIITTLIPQSKTTNNSNAKIKLLFFDECKRSPPIVAEFRHGLILS